MIRNAMKIELISFKTSKDYEKNLEKIINIIQNSPADFLLFPEVCLTGFDYKNWDEVNRFSKIAINELLKLKKTFALTIIEDNKNYFYFFDNGKTFKRAKYNLFGYENKYFHIGSKPEIFEWKNLKIANLICFELRFIEYWEKFKGVDLILVPSRWGKERMNHFKVLNRALSLSTQSEVLAVNSANEFSYGCSFDGWGEGVEFESERVLTYIDLEKNKKIRKKLNIGIK